MLEDALALHAQGRLAEAEEAYRAILAREPENAGIGHQLGLLAMEAGMPQAAVPIFEHVCTLAPDDAAFHANRGLAYLRCRRFADAIAASDRAIALNPGLYQAHLHRGIALKELQRPGEALDSFSRAVELRNDAAAHNFRALVLDELGRYPEALESFARAVALDGDNPLAHSNHGNALLRLFRYGEALASFQKAVALAPQMPGLHYNLGDPLKAMGRLEEAVTAYDCALALQPDMANAHVNRGLVLTHLGRGEKALAAFDRAVALEPESVAAHIGRSGALTGAGRIEESLAYDRELARNPLFQPEADFHSASVLLRRGDWEAGWKFYEARRSMEHYAEANFYPRYPQPEWTGEAAIEGKTLFVHGEQGLGDEIMLARYLKLARQAGAHVVFSPKGRLRRLLDGQGLADDVLPARTAPADFDLHIPLASMPRAFGTRPDNIPAEIPYLQAEPALAQTWRARIGAQGFRIGLTWAGAFDPIQGLDRSFLLRDCALLAALPGVRIISLQKFDGLEQLAGLPAGMAVESLGEDFDAEADAFVDTAAVMDSLDLVISCDTAVAHLAGALGRPVWTALKRDAEWRWGGTDETSSWYPTMTLFRQEDAGAWGPVFAAMRARLAAQLGVA